MEFFMSKGRQASRLRQRKYALVREFGFLRSDSAGLCPAEPAGAANLSVNAFTAKVMPSRFGGRARPDVNHVQSRTRFEPISNSVPFSKHTSDIEFSKRTDFLLDRFPEAFFAALP